MNDRQGKQRRAAMSAVMWCMLAGVMCGCASSKPSRYFFIQPTTQFKNEATERMVGSEAMIGLLPITLPDYIDRPQIVSVLGENELRIDEFNRWGASLRENIPLVVANQLLVHLGKGVYIDIYPWSTEAAFNYQLSMTVIRLDGMLGSSAELIVEWSVFEGRDERKPLVRRTTVYRTDITGEGYIPYVHGLRTVLNAFSKDVAKELVNLLEQSKSNAEKDVAKDAAS